MQSNPSLPCPWFRVRVHHLGCKQWSQSYLSHTQDLHSLVAVRDYIEDQEEGNPEEIKRKAILKQIIVINLNV